MGGKDHTVPEAITKSTLKQYRHSGAVTDLVEFAGRGHSLTIDSGWREVAEERLTWLIRTGNRVSDRVAPPHRYRYIFRQQRRSGCGLRWRSSPCTPRSRSPD
jgi:hypothetical protein